MKKLETKTCGTCGGRGFVPGNNVGSMLRAERDRLGVKAKDIAEALNISATYLRDLESDARTWTNELLESYQAKLAELVNG